MAQLKGFETIHVATNFDEILIYQDFQGKTMASMIRIPKSLWPNVMDAVKAELDSFVETGFGR